MARAGTVRRLVLTLVALTALAAAFAATIPIDAVVRRLLARASPPDLHVTFAAASLGWRGLTLREVAVTREGDALSRLPWLTLQPSIWGLLRGDGGYPLGVTGSTCNGWISGLIDRGSPGHRIEASFVDLELGPCTTAWEVPGQLTGTVEGRIDLMATSIGTATGDGAFHVRGAHWQAPGLPAHAPTSADDLRIEWTLHHDLVTLAVGELHNAELQATLVGTVRVAQPLARSSIDLLLTVKPRPAMPQAHRDLLLTLPGGPPDASGARRFAIGGTLGHPTIGRPAS